MAAVFEESGILPTDPGTLPSSSLGFSAQVIGPLAPDILDALLISPEEFAWPERVNYNSQSKHDAHVRCCSACKSMVRSGSCTGTCEMIVKQCVGNCRCVLMPICAALLIRFHLILQENSF